jgi:hypothetical protein
MIPAQPYGGPSIAERRFEATDCPIRERLALSTQCGFASNALGNEISVDARRAKLELVIR